MRVFKCMRMHNNSPAKSAVCPLNKPSTLCKIPEMRYNSATSNCEVSKQCAGTFKKYTQIRSHHICLKHISEQSEIVETSKVFQRP